MTRPGCSQFLHAFARHGQLRGPDLVGVVLHPAGLRKVLRELALRQRRHLAALVEGDGAAAGGALVECKDVSHGGKRSARALRLHCGQT